MDLVTIAGQPSWAFSSTKVKAAITKTGGHLGPVAFQLEGRTVEPLSIAPWAEETLDAATPPLLRALRGDFFCAPFGGNETVYQGEQHPPHGEVANADWTLEGLQTTAEQTEIHLSLETTIRKGRVDKRITLNAGETVLYSRHDISGMSGPMNFGHHAMLKFPDRPGSGRLSTSPMSFGQVVPIEFESRQSGGYTSLRRGAYFDRLEEVPFAFGGTVDLSRYPARPGFEDLVMVTHAASDDFAWSAVTFPEEGYVWFALKDPRVLRSTVLWLSNGGRHYAPWNGRHTGVMGIEDVTSCFHLGMAESAAPNSVNERGIATSLDIDEARGLCINYIMGIAPIGPSFDCVREICRESSGIRLVSTNGETVSTTLNHSFLYQL